MVTSSGKCSVLREILEMEEVAGAAHGLAEVSTYEIEKCVLCPSPHGVGREGACEGPVLSEFPYVPAITSRANTRASLE